MGEKRNVPSKIRQSLLDWSIEADQSPVMRIKKKNALWRKDYEE